MIEEIWKPICGFDGYEISNLFRVRSATNKMQHKSFNGFLKLHFNNNYFGVTLYKNGRRHYRKIHKLYAIAFIPNSENKKYVNHINGIKHDNRRENLEWCSASENQKHAYMIGLRKPTYNRRKKVAQIKKDGLVVQIFDSVFLAVKHFNPKAINGASICRSIRNNTPYHKYYFKHI